MATGAIAYRLAELPATAQSPLAAGASANPDLAEAARQFETIFTKILLDTAFKDGLAGTGQGSQAGHVRDLWASQMAAQLGQGGGLGLARALQESLTPAAAAAPTAAGAVALNGLRLGAEATAGPQLQFATPEEFLGTLRPLAGAAAARLGLQAEALLAQSALETGWGRHLPGHPAQPSFNLFGIKASPDWAGPRVTVSTREHGPEGWRVETAEFRRYGSYAESFSDYVDFLQSQPRYAEALQHGGSSQKFFAALGQAGYATDPDYAGRVMAVANSAALRARES